MKLEIHNSRKVDKLTEWMEDNPIEATIIFIEEMRAALKSGTPPDEVAETLELIETSMSKNGYKK